MTKIATAPRVRFKTRGRPRAQLTTGKPVGRQLVWEQIRALRTFTVKDIAAATHLEATMIRHYVSALYCGGYLDLVPHGDISDVLRYRLVRDVGIEAPRLKADGSPCTGGLAREQMWRTMRMLSRPFDARDLVNLASTDARKVAVASAKEYCGYLAKAGYLEIVRPGAPSRLTQFRFLMARYTGPKAPIVQRIQTVYDPNTRLFVWHAEGALT